MSDMWFDIFNKRKKNNSSETKISRVKQKSLIDKYEAIILTCNESISKLSDKVNNLQQSLKSAQDYIEQMRSENSLLSSQLQDKTEQLRAEKTNNQKLEEKIICQKEENEQSSSKTIKIISELIRFCDLMRSISSTTVDEFISFVSNKIEYTLIEYGVTITKESDGVFNPSCHCIVEIQETDDMSLDNHIAKVLRPGYWLGNRCFIPQDVIVFTVKK